MGYDHEVSNVTIVSPHCGIVTVAVTAKGRFKGNTTEHKSVETLTLVGHGDDLLIVKATVSPNTPNP